MPTRYFPIALFVAILIAVACYGFLRPAETAAVPMRVLLDNSAGLVVFDHAKHVDEYGVDCETCHHELLDEADEDGNIPEDAEPAACSDCHSKVSDDPDVPGLMDAYHQSCMGCHEEIDAGPYTQDQCNQCHFK
ncbi:cytochrome c3 family protein [Halodesulfovibrio sp.]|uniref:cytochrome c3 family protein n=1 Tax=Halodesulfovibrio sp. TaxID=1912772 RepID=UPI0025EEB617|nr:cytochrome c3 family protein [Halodesulfovibrio sp.]MCT4535011.1 cytochrome c family protein [Halodesulfovibrio sp.]MCT4626147.1 cytochrome c family protein [Halodesulfovibrio sp.]